MKTYDLHTHSTASDGLLDPTTLLERAGARKVDVMALTDHDSVGGIAEARKAAALAGVHLVAGVEISVSWQGQLIHIVGLNIDDSHPELLQGLESLRNRRDDRAVRMALKLEKIGIPSPLQGAQRYQTTDILSRSHFARYLVEIGKADTFDAAFKQFLNPGTPGHVSMEWATVAEAVTWIKDAGGKAVVAHPGRYRMSEVELHRFLNDFIDAGGYGIEVVCSNLDPVQIDRFARVARTYGLRASKGSDFHSPSSRRELGRLAPLPQDLTPVWQDQHW
ncbi:MAG: PHP domain-containing protein [Gammaproteobacteria bacterium]|nr:PHP domain-containing protein [Gammaproteobacteria bacterium]